MTKEKLMEWGLTEEQANKVMEGLNGSFVTKSRSKYYRDIGKRAEETLANYGALSVVRPDLIEMLRKDKPELVEALEEVIQDMLKKAGG